MTYNFGVSQLKFTNNLRDCGPVEFCTESEQHALGHGALWDVGVPPKGSALTLPHTPEPPSKIFFIS
jgi:hypothetical protein